MSGGPDWSALGAALTGLALAIAEAIRQRIKRRRARRRKRRETKCDDDDEGKPPTAPTVTSFSPTFFPPRRQKSK